MIDLGLVSRDALRAGFDRIKGGLYRYPAVDPASFRSAVEEAIATTEG